MSKRIKPWDKTDSLEAYMRRQERLIVQNERYKRLMVIPIVVIAVSLSVLAYNFTAGQQPNTKELQSYTDVEAKVKAAPDKAPKEMINLNTATADMLDSLPGIGTKKAEAIIETRERMGGFRSVEDILNVEGIGEKILAEIQNMIYVDIIN